MPTNSNLFRTEVLKYNDNQLYIWFDWKDDSTHVDIFNEDGDSIFCSYDVVQDEQTLLNECESVNEVLDWLLRNIQY